jgi:NAD(P)-dependent dehydrogenase (short-subunit alcohol dehydrogenase family)
MAARELENRCAIITGASQGLGLEIAKHYLAAGANLMICARSPEPLNQSCSTLRKLADVNQSVVAMTADVSCPADVTRLVERTLSEFGRLDILVSNAGIAGPIGAVESVDWREWTRAIEINLLGPVLLTRAVLPHFKQAGRGKILQLSGGGATTALPMLSAYAASKAAAVRFMETLAEETRPYHIDVNAIAPGVLDTRILDEFLAAGPDKIGRAFHERSLQHKHSGGVSLAKGAELAVFLASSASDGITGKLISAVWDPWQTLPDHRDDLNRTDIYTLRRIQPQDRQMGWGDVD